MIPFDLVARTLEIAGTDEQTIVLATGTEPRHERFALRLQQEFGRDVIAWYRWPAPAKPAVQAPSWRRRVKQAAKQILGRTPAPKASSIFVDEVVQLREHALIAPQDIPDSNANAFLLEEMARLRPFFFLTLGGGLYSADVLNTVRGMSINQHAGYSPDYKGNQTTLQALYHRDLRRVAATVHVTTTGADAGPILRRSTPCLDASDTPHSIAERVVALGSELMIECVHEIRNTGRILAFDQPNSGITYLSREANQHVRAMVNSDFAQGWLGMALKQRETW